MFALFYWTHWPLVAALIAFGILLLLFHRAKREWHWWQPLALGFSLPYALAFLATDIALHAAWHVGAGLSVLGLFAVVYQHAPLLFALGVFVWWKFFREGFGVQINKIVALIIVALAVLGHLASKI